MSTNTTNMAMGKSVDGDNARTYLETTLGAALDTIDAHVHGGTTSGLKIPTGSISAVAFTTFTPTMTQSGGLTLSAATGRYVQIGKLVVGSIAITINSAGTIANPLVVLGLPVVATLNGSPGSGYYTRSGSTFYSAALAWNTTTSVIFYGGNGTGALGTNPSFAAAAGDAVGINFMYEAA